MSAALKGDQEVRKKSAKQLAAGYSTGKRMMDWFSVLAFGGLFLNNVIMTGRYYKHEAAGASPISTLVLFLGSVFLALLGGDMFSGIAHWALDTWGSTDTPVFGAFIRSFREHHVNQASICDHDFVETNGDNCLVTLPVLTTYALLPISSTGSLFCTPEAHVFFAVFMLAIAATNQIHKSAHMRRPSPLAKKLSDMGLILSAQQHRIHHSGEFEHSYCITTGWLNKPLDVIGFWRHFECLITSTTGAVPRGNDKEMLGEK